MERWSAAHRSQLERALTLVADHQSSTVDELQSLLYHRWYAPPAEMIIHLDPLDPPLPAVLREAHAGGDVWLSGATVISAAAAGVLVVSRSGESPRAVVRGDYTHPVGSARAGLMPRAGDQVLVLQRRTAPPSEGWWRTWGPGWNLLKPPTGLARVYLAPDPDRVAGLVQALTKRLGSAAFPWMLKVAADPLQLLRPDGAVLYLPIGDRCEPDQLPLVKELAQLVGDYLRPVSPPLTLVARPGMAIAEDPGDGQSFGETICALLAQVLSGDSATGGELDMIADHFEAAGVDPQQPFRRPRSPQEVPL